jgi:hypothetical protein
LTAQSFHIAEVADVENEEAYQADLQLWQANGGAHPAAPTIAQVANAKYMDAYQLLAL